MTGINFVTLTSCSNNTTWMMGHRAIIISRISRSLSSACAGHRPSGLIHGSLGTIPPSIAQTMHRNLLSIYVQLIKLLVWKQCSNADGETFCYQRSFYLCCVKADETRIPGTAANGKQNVSSAFQLLCTRLTFWCLTKTKNYVLEQESHTSRSPQSRMGDICNNHNHLISEWCIVKI